MLLSVFGSLCAVPCQWQFAVELKHATLREKFDTYVLAPHKEELIKLLRRVTTVSVETARIASEMSSGRPLTQCQAQ